MLMQRVITALVLLPLLLAAVWFLPTAWLYLVFAGAGLLIAWEWSALMQLPSAARCGYVLLTAVLLTMAWVFRIHWFWLCVASMMWWCYAAALVRTYPASFASRAPGTAAMALIGQLLIAPTILALAVLHSGGAITDVHSGPLRLLYMFFLIFAADTGAYFAGRKFGRRKLAPSVSPGKSVEGAIGGLLLCAVWALTCGVAVFFGGVYAPLGRLAAFVALSLLVAAISILGDLSESMFKRAAGVKDSGTILPGHGGILDRTDSLLAAAPLMALGLFLLKL
ncbi:MAG: Phosphatidate cytidylyltransferase [Hydrocarboniphaga sp.]|uniref:phosphatidate cytidylyltransferase n=1 Tax=Hydrocarboniphaga sp. TaxID=2033016 RepID=UPI0026145397|nr:phosphatidate cytidylyltransferase [Hydrocarboniphaga sp.]MDB5968962.1 Phosphatidate cytidylyltransferase [Hydrocarboniphaga sp.]